MSAAIPSLGFVHRRGPRGGLIPSGRCSCDVPVIDSVAAVRAWAKALGTCSTCGDDGINLVTFGDQRLHVRCFVRNYGVMALAKCGAADRAALCCLGVKRMKELLRLREGRGAP